MLVPSAQARFPTRVPDQPVSTVPITGVHHVGVVVDDLERTCRLLEQTFGLQPSRSLERADIRAIFLTCVNTEIELIEVLDPRARAARLGERRAVIEHIAFGVEELAATISSLEAFGVRMNEPSRTSGGARTAFTDAATTNGLVFQFVETGSASD